MGGSTVDAMTKSWLITGAGRGMGVECRLAQANDFETRS
jgi:NAD(P)-dependent dehydrogenase (short-subunit alcohol dehydrogenase family)